MTYDELMAMANAETDTQRKVSLLRLAMDAAPDSEAFMAVAALIEQQPTVVPDQPEGEV